MFEGEIEEVILEGNPFETDWGHEVNIGYSEYQRDRRTEPVPKWIKWVYGRGK